MNATASILSRLAPPFLAALLGACALTGTHEPSAEEWHRAEVATARGEWDLAADLWNRLRHATFHTSPRAHLETATALAALGQPEDALALLDRAREIFPDDTGLLAARGRLLSTMGFRRAAEVDLREAVRIGPDDPAAWASLGQIQLELEEPRQAAASLDRAVALDRTSASDAGAPGPEAGAEWSGGMSRSRAHQLAARAHRDVGDLDRAHELYGRAIDLARANAAGEVPNALLIEGASLHTDHTDEEPTCPRLAEALAWILLARDQDPQCSRAAFVHGCLLERQGVLGEAVVAYRRAVEIDNLHLGALTNLALIHARLGEDKRCAAMVERALALEVDERRREALMRLLRVEPAP